MKPLSPLRAADPDVARRTRAYLQSPNPQYARAAQLSIERSVPPGERQRRHWEPWTAGVFVPLFALANAGVELSPDTLRTAATSSVTLGVVAGLVLGKLAGVTLGAGLAVRLRLGELAPGLRAANVTGGAILTGIGFTISLFIVDLAFDDDSLADQARVGVLGASLLAALLGSAVMRWVARRQPHAARPHALTPPIDPERDHLRGPTDAPLTLVEYGDFECPFCGRVTGTIEDLRARFGNRLRYVFRHAPLADIHPHAQLAAEAAEAAAAQGRFWEMYDRLYAARDRLSGADLLDHAAALDLDLPRFARDLGAGRYTRIVQHDLESADASGVAGTPTFFVNGQRHTGPTDADTLAHALVTSSNPELAAGDPSQAAAEATTRPDAPLVAVVNLPDIPGDAPETPERGGDHPRLDDEQLAQLERVGTRRQVARGDTLYRAGEPGYDFHVILSGAVAVVGQPPGGDQPVVRVHGPRRFLGELDLFSPQPVLRTAVVIRDGEVLRLTVDELQNALAQDAETRDLIVRAYLSRRAIRYELAADLRIIGRGESPEVRRLQQYAQAHHLTSAVIDIDTDEAGHHFLDKVGVTPDALPVVVTRTGAVLHQPDETALAEALPPP